MNVNIDELRKEVVAEAKEEQIKELVERIKIKLKLQEQYKRMCKEKKEQSVVDCVKVVTNYDKEINGLLEQVAKLKE